MESDYDYYLAGCRKKGVKSLSPWRFRIAYAWYQREADKPFADILALDLKQRAGLMARLDHYKTLAESMLLGHGMDRFPRPRVDDEPGNLPGSPPGSVMAGDRAALPPPEPILAGAAARPLPAPDAPDQSFWRV